MLLLALICLAARELRGYVCKQLGTGRLLLSNVSSVRKQLLFPSNPSVSCNFALLLNVIVTCSESPILLWDGGRECVLRGKVAVC
jgi:hypothetical protein